MLLKLSRSMCMCSSAARDTYPIVVFQDACAGCPAL